MLYNSTSRVKIPASNSLYSRFSRNIYQVKLVNQIIEGSCFKLAIDPDWLNDANYPIVIDPTIYLPDATFIRSSTAYKQDGTQVANNIPRYEDGKFGQALMIEEATTNLIGNPSFETDISGWGYGGNQSITRITTGHYFGSACGQITSTGQGGGATGTVQYNTGVSNGVG